jgi:hypothetical protein
MTTRRQRLENRLDRARARVFEHLAAVSAALLADKASVAGRLMEELIQSAQQYAELVAEVLSRRQPHRRCGR